MRWQDDWPVMGDNGIPVLAHRKPDVGANYPRATPPDSDDFNGSRLGPQWQWQANPQPGWGFPSAALGVMRLINVPTPEGYVNFWNAPNLLLQKFPAPRFTVTTKLTFTPRGGEDRAGLVIMGTDYTWIGLRKRGDGLVLTQVGCLNADQGNAESEWASRPVNSNSVWLRARVVDDAKVRLSYSFDGKTFNDIGREFTAQPGRWIGAKIGLFAMGAPGTTEYGNADFDDFIVE
jgi:beta-xylosidase